MPDGHTPLDFVLLYAPPWSGPTRFSKHHLAEHLARTGGRVLYVEAPLTPVGVRRGRGFLAELAHTTRPAKKMAERLWVRRHFVPVPYHAATAWTSSRRANRLAQRLLAPMLQRDLRQIGFVPKPVVIAGLPHVADLLPWLPRRALIYHCADDYASVRGFPRSLPKLEADLCRQADLVITTSETLCADRQKFNANTHWVPNGADVQHFGQAAPPANELKPIQRPVVGFVGGLSEWVDIGLVADLAAARPGVSFVLVGPIGTDVAPLANLPNVHLLGARPYAELPSYLAAMDVALIPFKQDRVTYHADPIKAYEYLAAGLPVVATDMPALRRLAHVVRLAHDTPGFMNEIDTALANKRENGFAERQAEATRHSWTSRFQVIDALIDQTLHTCAP